MRFKDFHRNIQIRLTADFISTTAGTMVFPFMAIYFAEHFGTKITGAIMIINIVIGIIAGLYGGYFSDRLGRKKMMQLSGSLRIFAYTIMALTNSPWFESPVITFFMMTISSVSWGIGGPASRAMLIDVSSPENRKYIFAISYWLTNLSVTAGSIAGAFLIKDYRFELFVSLSIVSVVSWALIEYFIKDTYVPIHSEGKRNVIREMAYNYTLVLKDKIFLKYMIAIILLGSLEAQLTNYVGIRLEKEMLTHKFTVFTQSISIDGIRMMGVLQTENTIIVVAATALLALIFNRFKDYNVLIVGLIIYTIGYSIVGYSNAPFLLLFAMLLATVGEILQSPISEAKLAEIADGKHRSAYMAVSGLRWNIGMIIASLIVFIGSFVPPWVISGLFALMGVTSIVLMHIVFKQNELNHTEQKEPA